MSFEVMRKREEMQRQRIEEKGYKMVIEYYCQFVKKLKTIGSPENTFASAFRRTYYPPWKPRLYFFKTFFFCWLIVMSLWLSFRWGLRGGKTEVSENFTICPSQRHLSFSIFICRPTFWNGAYKMTSIDV